MSEGQQSAIARKVDYLAEIVGFVWMVVALSPLWAFVWILSKLQGVFKPNA